MNTVGIVAEYNPFHRGHEYHLNKTKALFSDSTVVCVMSGDFVQRGHPAIFSKYVRAEAACRCGADLVVELPVPWSLASAEGFARGAVELLSALNVDHISFGSESGEIKSLEQMAKLLLNKCFIEDVKSLMRKNPELSFPSAREETVRRYGIAAIDTLQSANNILGVEYIKAIRTLSADIIPVCIKREGNGHDEHGGVGLLSASEIRMRLSHGASITSLVPENAAGVYCSEQTKGRIFSETSFDTAVLSRLRMFGKEYFSSLPDTADGLGDRIYKAVRNSSSLIELYESTKTKRYAMSRVRRAVMSAAIGITADMSTKSVPYIRVLAANERGCALLKKNKALPIITKAAEIRRQGEFAERVFATGESAHDLYTLCFNKNSVGKCGEEWEISPKIVKI